MPQADGRGLSLCRLFAEPARQIFHRRPNGLRHCFVRYSTPVTSSCLPFYFCHWEHWLVFVVYCLLNGPSGVRVYRRGHSLEYPQASLAVFGPCSGWLFHPSCCLLDSF